MSKLPVLSAKDVIKILDKFGFQVYRQSGSHIHLWNEDTKLLVTVPNHRELAKGTLISIMKQAKIDRDNFSLKLKRKSDQ
ncbi:MAG: type II toxin-antitoxin system HicA family toxin [Methanosarcinaceae archaeon]